MTTAPTAPLTAARPTGAQPTAAQPTVFRVDGFRNPALPADRRLRYLPVYLGREAVPAPGEVPGPDGREPRWHRSNQRWERVKANPIMAAMHEHSPDHACGDNELQVPDFASYQWEWMADVPN